MVESNWNMNDLGKTLENEIGVRIAGLTTPSLFNGTQHSTFEWHVEDMDLYSISILHYGHNKLWYGMYYVCLDT
jgi:hypothetical protein